MQRIAKVHVDCWRTTYTGIIPDDILHHLSYERRGQLWLDVIPRGIVFVAENGDGEIVGFSDGGKERSGKYNNFDGELNAIYLLEEYQGQGIGTLLVRSVVAELKKIGMHAMMVTVLEDNKSCLFYEKLGGKIIDNVEVEFSRKEIKRTYFWLG